MRTAVTAFFGMVLLFAAARYAHAQGVEWQSLNDEVTSLYQKGQYDKAVVELERAFKKLPKDSTVAEHLGDALAKVKRYPEALEVYRKALTLENSNRGELEKKIKTTEQLLKGRAP